MTPSIMPATPPSRRLAHAPHPPPLGGAPPPAGHGLVMALSLTLLFAGVEAGAGVWAHSLALLSDAGHMFSDTLALGLSLFALWLAHRPPSARHSYGYVRSEILVALVNSLVLLAVVIAIVVAAIDRLRHPQPVDGLAVMVVAAIGIIVNVAVVAALSREAQSLNTRSAILHVLGDLLGSAAALIAGAVIYFTGWMPIDPILSMVIAALILYSTLRLLREVVNILMEGVPTHLDLPVVGRRMAEVAAVLSVHDLHIWTLSSGTQALSAHIVIDDPAHWGDLLQTLQAMLESEFAISHVTLQPEILNPPVPGRHTIIPIHRHP